jgi:hypothetical protein
MITGASGRAVPLRGNDIDTDRSCRRGFSARSPLTG